MQETGANVNHGTATGRSARRLSTHQQAVLIQVLLAFPDETVGVCSQSSAPGAHDYAEDFLNIFKALNWNVNNDVEVCERLPVAPSGLALLVTENRVPPSAEALRDALRIYSLEAEITTDRLNLCGSRNFVLAVSQA
jgi:hypothetical protein